MTATDSGEPTTPNLDSLEQQVIAFFHNKGISLDTNNTEACHPLPRKNKSESEKPAIIICFVDKKHKQSLLKREKTERNQSVHQLTTVKEKGSHRQTGSHPKEAEQTTISLDIQLQSIHKAERLTRSSKSICHNGHSRPGQISVITGDTETTPVTQAHKLRSDCKQHMSTFHIHET